MELLGAFCTGFFFALFLFGFAVGSNENKIEELKKENNKLRRLSELHIGQEVYACKSNFLRIGKITKITHSVSDDKVTLDGYREFSKSEIYLTKEDALKQLKI